MTSYKKEIAAQAAALPLQFAIMVALYPILFAMAMRQRGHWCNMKCCGMYFFPAWGKWWLPMPWLWT